MRVAVAIPVVAVFVVLPSCGGGGGGGGGDGSGAPAAATWAPGVAYVADADVDEQFELFTADLDGSGARKVSHSLLPSDDVAKFAWSPDRSLLAYTVSHTGNQRELFVATPEGTSSVRVSPNLGVGETVGTFSWSPSSSHLAFTTIQFDPGFLLLLGGGLWSVRPDGTNLVEVSPELPAGRSIESFGWSPDSQRLADTADVAAEGVPRLYTVAASGGLGVEVSASLPADRAVRFSPTSSSSATESFAWSPDSSRLAFVAEHREGTDGFGELFTVIPGSLPVGLFVAGPASIVILDFAWAPNGARVAFLTGPYSYAVQERLRTDLPGGGDPRVIDAGLTVASVPIRFAWSPTSCLAFNILTETSESSTWLESSPGGSLGLIYVFPVPSDGALLWSPLGSWLTLGGAIVSHGVPGDAQYMNLEPDIVEGIFWSPDELEVAYTTSALSHFAWEALVSRPDTKFGRVRVSPPLGVSRGVVGLQWTPDSSRLVYTVDLLGFDEYELFASDRNGSSWVRLSGPLVSGGTVTTFAVR